MTPLKKLLTTTPNAWGQADTKYTKVKTFNKHVVSVVFFVVNILFSVDSQINTDDSPEKTPNHKGTRKEEAFIVS